MTALPTITCDGCGVCCMHMAVPPYDEEEMEMLETWQPEIYAEMKAIIATRAVQLKATGVDQIPCAFFDMVTRKCRHHEYSPDICARYEVGGIFCREQRQEAGLYNGRKFAAELREVS